MKVKGIKRAVADFNQYAGAAVVWMSPGLGSVETLVYKEPLDFRRELACRFIPLEVKGIGGSRDALSQVTETEVESDIGFLRTSVRIGEIRR